MNKTNLLPKQSVLYPGCILGCLANAVARARSFPFLFDQWDDKTYIYDGLDGNFAAISFHSNFIVGTLFDHESDRNPFRSSIPFDVNLLFCGMPASHTSLAKQCLRYWHQRKDDLDIQLVTAAFWNDKEFLTANESWKDVLRHGGHIIYRQLIEDLDIALREWQEAYQLSTEESKFVKSVFQRKMNLPVGSLTLDRIDIGFLKALGEGDKEAFEAGKSALASIGIDAGEWGREWH